MLVEATFLIPYEVIITCQGEQACTLTDFLLVLLLDLVLRLFMEGFSSLSGLDGRERGNGDPFDEYPFAELSKVLSKLCRIIMGSMQAANISEMIPRNAIADSDANMIGKRDTRPL